VGYLAPHDVGRTTQPNVQTSERRGGRRRGGAGDAAICSQQSAPVVFFGTVLELDQEHAGARRRRGVMAAAIGAPAMFHRAGALGGGLWLPGMRVGPCPAAPIAVAMPAPVAAELAGGDQVGRARRLESSSLDSGTILPRGTLVAMPGLGALLAIVAVLVLLLVVAYRLGYRVGKAEGRLLGREEADERQRSA